jgi:hypothetical protein
MTFFEGVFLWLFWRLTSGKPETLPSVETPSAPDPGPAPATRDSRHDPRARTGAG